MIADLVLYNIKTLYTPHHEPPLRHQELNDILSIDDAYLAIKDGVIIGFGAGDGAQHIDESTTVHDLAGAIVCPGFIDGHSHLVHAGSREDEFALLREGVPYLDILAKGGGIHGTVKKTQEATPEALFKQAYTSLDRMMAHGVTTLEAKSGYGLERATERKQLQVARQLNQQHPVRLISTYMGAHALPKAYTNKRKTFIDQVIRDLDVIKKEDLAEAVDIFCEKNAFTVQEAKTILTAAQRKGFKVKIHADEIVSLGGTALGVKLGATSVDHLMAITNDDIERLADSDTVANILPGTSFHLNRAYARARTMIDKGVAVAVAGDYNPGSCPTENFMLIMQLAANQLKMKPGEVLSAVTLNAAYHLGLSGQTGSIATGKQADLVVLDAPNLAYTLYHFGINHVKDVYIGGQRVVHDRQITRRNP
ncbi:MAG: imidazolonepropionase [Acholeplasmataceae bacterium]|nr:MAG: imidazolonepropionase [Acholeplasmataceae bacterium]